MNLLPAMEKFRKEQKLNFTTEFLGVVAIQIIRMLRSVVQYFLMHMFALAVSLEECGERLPTNKDSARIFAIHAVDFYLGYPLLRVCWVFSGRNIGQDSDLIPYR